MDFIQDVLKKAKEERMADPRIIPWEQPNSENWNVRERPKDQYDSFGRWPKIPSDMLADVQRVLENIHLAGNGKAPQVIGFTSAVPKEGTSTIVAASAFLAAGRQNRHNETVSSEMSRESARETELNGRKCGTLLIDAQVRHPSLHKKFGVPNKLGLIDLFAYNISLNSVVKNVSASNLKLITVGGEREPGSLLDTEKFGSLIEEVKQQFEFVFIDIPSLLHDAQGVTISKLCDAVVLVIRAGQTRWQVLQEAQELLPKANVNLLGGILNRRRYPIPESIYRKL